MTDRSKLTGILNRVFAWKHNSLAEYIVRAEPYVADDQAGLLEDITNMADLDAQQADQLVTIIEKLQGIPQVVPYQPFVSELNYLSLGYLKGVLSSELERQIKVLEEDLNRCDGEVPVQECLSTIVETTREQLKLLQ